MKFRKFGKALLISALSVGAVLGVTSCVQSYTVGFLFVTGTTTAGNAQGIISGFKIDHNTGNLWIGDVGQDSFEEVDMVTPMQGGSNMGWRCKEGTHNFNFTANCQTATFLDPIFDYDHSQGDDTVIGGYVYHGTSMTALAGNYIFGDFISGRIWSLAQNAQGQWVRTLLANSGPGNLAGFGQDAAGELYVAQYGSGNVARLHQVGTP